MKAAQPIDTRKARIYFTDGHVESFNDQRMAFAVWLALPHGVRAAFRGKDDDRPVYPWECVDTVTPEEIRYGQPPA